MVRTISYDQEEIIKGILKLHNNGNPIDLDPTYSKGFFYKKTSIKEPLHKYDLNPRSDEVKKACATNLPFDSCSVSCIMFDPPFLATKGKSLKDKTKNKILQRFGVFENELKLHTFYIDALTEMYRILKKDGILIFKCQDKVSSGKQYFSHCFIKEEAEKIGFYSKDLFILMAKNRIVADWQLKNQKHARKFHSYFWVFQKRIVNLKYPE